MATEYPVIDIRVLTGVRRIMEAEGIPFAELAERCGIEPARFDTSTGFVSLNSVGCLFDFAADHIGDRAFGLKVGTALPMGASGLLGHIMMSSPTVRGMLQATADYIALYQRPLTCHFDEDNGVGVLSWIYPPQFTAPRIQYSLFAVSTLVMRIRQATGQSWMPLAVDCDFMPPADTTLIRKVLGHRINFQQSRMAIWIDPTALSMPLPQVMEGLEASVRQLGDRVLAELGETASHRAAVEAHLRRRMVSGMSLQLEDVAGDMGLSARALQYRLEQEDTGFEVVLGAIRSSEAVHYLRDTDFSLAEIADKLGFSEASAFTRAMRQRFDMAPREMRRHLREGKTIGPASN